MKLRWLAALGLLSLAVGFAAVRSWVRPPAPPGELPVLARVPDFRLVDERGETVRRADLLDRVWVASFLFTRCAGQCPVITRSLERLQRSFARADGFRLVSFSVDPEHDRPEILAEFAGRVGAEAGRWRFLTGERDSIYRLAREGFLLGVEPAPDPNGRDRREPILHTPRLVLVDAEGRVRGYYSGVEEDAVARLHTDVSRLLAGGS